jgi:hypothetical protein
MIRSFRKLGASDELNKVQDNIEYVLGPVLSSAIIDGVLLNDVKLVSGLNVVDHKLGREPRGWIVVSPQANEQIWSSGQTRSTLLLNASGPITSSFWVF